MLSSQNTSEKNIPLAVDLDGTLIKTDTLFEALLCLLKKKPWLVFLMVVWLLQGGRALLKKNIAERVELDPSLLPYHTEFLAFLKQEKAKGRVLELVSATDQRLADCVGNYVGIFDHIKGSDGTINLRDEAKRAYLDGRFNSSYDYAGNSHPDLDVWKGAKGAYVVNASLGLKENCEKLCEVRAYYPKEKLNLKVILSLLGVKFLILNFILAILFGLFHIHNFLGIFIISFLGLSFASAAAFLVCTLLKLDQLRQVGSKNWIVTGDFAISHAIVFSAVLFLMSFFVFILLLPWSLLFFSMVYLGLACFWYAKH